LTDRALCNTKYGMHEHWADERLQVIRTLMERAAIYRRALTPIMSMLGLLGFVAAVCGWFFHINEPVQFGLFWMSISVVALCGAYFLVRRQALQEKEPFWSPPTRRVTQALLPCLFAGAVVGVFFPRWNLDQFTLTCILPSVWMLIYGCAVHAAGFFMPRGIRLLGWLFILAGSGLLLGLTLATPVYFYSVTKTTLAYAHLLMGLFFGGFHLAYAIYLFFTEKRNS
jgi:hypothetical protein